MAITPASEPGPYGRDEVEIRLAAHPGAPELPLHKGASGGELSRVMGAIEVVFAGADPVPTFVFDEVNAGVGGRAAVEVGRRLARLARLAQVIVVTHLPQVAAFADTHLVVEKSDDGSVTSSGVIHLDRGSRVRRAVPDAGRARGLRAGSGACRGTPRPGHGGACQAGQFVTGGRPRGRPPAGRSPVSPAWWLPSWPHWSPRPYRLGRRIPPRPPGRHSPSPRPRRSPPARAWRGDVPGGCPDAQEENAEDHLEAQHQGGHRGTTTRTAVRY